MLPSQWGLPQLVRSNSTTKGRRDDSGGAKDEEISLDPAAAEPSASQPEPKGSRRGILGFMRSFSSISDHDAISWTPNPALHTTKGHHDASDGHRPQHALAKDGVREETEEECLLGASAPLISPPMAASHELHVVYNTELARFEGMPAEWKGTMNRQFGLPLHETPKVDVEGYPQKIPAVLVMLKNHLLAGNGLESEGIFRLAPDKDECDTVKSQINEGTFVGEEGSGDVNVFANLIKVWFRECPQQLFEHITEGQMSTIAGLKSAEEVSTAMEGFAEPHRSIILWLLDLLAAVVAKERVNRMSARNLAIVISPNLFRFGTATTMDPLLAMTRAQVVSEFTLKLLEARIAVTTPAPAAPTVVAAEDSSIPAPSPIIPMPPPTASRPGGA